MKNRIAGIIAALVIALPAVVISTLIGALNGLLIGFFGLRSTVVTLAVGAISTAFALQHFSADYAAPPEALQKMKHKAGTAKANDVRRSGDHKRQPQCSATMPPVIC